MPTFKHPDTGVEITGTRLTTGETLQPNDMYASTDGRWQKNPFGVTTLHSDHVLWVRQEIAVSSA